jgi:hypothetical protein
MLHESLIPITITPTRVKIKPIHTARVMGSLIVKGESSATHSGIVLTNTTELATVVYCSEVIQVAKCTARNAPESNASPSALRLSELSSRL